MANNQTGSIKPGANVSGGNAKTLGWLIRDRRVKAGLSQENLADEIGSDFRTISKYEKGEMVPSAIRLFEIAKALDVTVDEFVPTSLQGRTRSNMCNLALEELDAFKKAVDKSYMKARNKLCGDQVES